MRVSHFLTISADRFTNRPAIVHGERRVTYSQLAHAVNSLRERLAQLQLEPGSRAALLYDNSIEYAAAYFAIIEAGLVVVPVDTSLQPEKVRYILDDCQASVLITHTRFARHLPRLITDDGPVRHLITNTPLVNMDLPVATDSLEEIVGPDESRWPADGSPEVPEADGHFRRVSRAAESAERELAAIFYTSGSTGTPKGVMLSHRNLIANTVGTVSYLQLTERDSVCVILPFYYIYGNSLLLTHAAAGGTLVIDNRFTYPEAVLDTMEKEQVTGFSGVPSTFMILLNNSTLAQRPLKALRYVTQAGGAMAPEVTRRLCEVLPNQQIFIMYGQTEASPRVSWLPPDRLAEKLGSAGIPVPGVEIRIVDESGREVPPGQEGEITVGGDSVMMGYWNQPEEQAEVLRDGWLHTGDLAHKDEEGFIYIVGRRKEIIKPGGNRVSAKEIEESLLEHPAVAEAAAFGVADSVLGEAIKVAIVLKPGQATEPSELQDFCKAKLATHKVPKYIELIARLPKSQSGKINKLELKKLLNGCESGVRQSD